MIGGEQSVEIAVAPDKLWEYMTDFGNWAEHVIGFRRLQVVSDTRSVWTLRGDVGILAREVDIQVDRVAQEPGRRADFTLTGLTERISGEGSFEVQPADGAPPTSEEPDADRPGRLQRMSYRMAARIAGAKGSGTSPQTAGSAEESPDPAERADGPRSRLTFRLQVAPGGPMAPMLEMLMKPLLKPAADDICTRIANDLGGLDGDD